MDGSHCKKVNNWCFIITRKLGFDHLLNIRVRERTPGYKTQCTERLKKKQFSSIANLCVTQSCSSPNHQSNRKNYI